MRVTGSILVLALGLAACDATDPPPPMAGTVQYRLVSPAGPEGAMLLEGPAAEIGALSTNDIRIDVLSHADGGVLHIAVVHRAGGELTFFADVEDIQAPPELTLKQVVHPGNEPRADLGGYALEVVQ